MAPATMCYNELKVAEVFYVHNCCSERNPMPALAIRMVPDDSFGVLLNITAFLMTFFGFGRPAVSDWEDF